MIKFLYQVTHKSCNANILQDTAILQSLREVYDVNLHFQAPLVRLISAMKKWHSNFSTLPPSVNQKGSEEERRNQRGMKKNPLTPSQQLTRESTRYQLLCLEMRMEFIRSTWQKTLVLWVLCHQIVQKTVTSYTSLDNQSVDSDIYLQCQIS